MPLREEEGEDDVCAPHIWLQTTFLTDESDDEDDEDVAGMGNLFKKYKSHRRLSSSLLLENVEKEYSIKQKTTVRFKRSK